MGGHVTTGTQNSSAYRRLFTIRKGKTMQDQAKFKCHNGYTTFELCGHMICFMTSSKLEKYTRVVERSMRQK